MANKKFWRVVSSLKSKVIIALCDDKFSYIYKTIIMSYFNSELDKGLNYEYPTIIKNLENVNLIKAALEKKYDNMVIYFRADYRVPLEFSMSRKPYDEHIERSIVWSNISGQFLNTNERLHEFIKSHIKEKDLLNIQTME